MAWGNKKRNWQKRAHAGYTEYRYGGKTKKPTLPQVFKGEARKSAINQIMDALDDWRNSPFENEGYVHHGIRSALCLKGESWEVSNHEAVALVGEAFGRLGCSRPSWEEAQRWYTGASDNCGWCTLPLPDTLKRGAKIMYCSTECANKAWAAKQFDACRSADKGYSAMYRAVKRLNLQPVVCERCGISFSPGMEGQRFCSNECKHLAHRVTYDVKCQHCEKQFKLKTLSRISKFCSNECRYAHDRARVLFRKCELCDIAFIATKETARFCCNAHAMAASQIGRKIATAAKEGREYVPRGPYREYTLREIEARRRPPDLVCLTADIFDKWFRKAA